MITPATLGLLLTLLLALLGRLLYLHRAPFTFDESYNLIFGFMAAQKRDIPYQDMFVSVPPLALMVSEWAATWFGNTLQGRYPIMLLNLGGVATLFWLLNRQAATLPVVTAMMGPSSWPLGLQPPSLN